MSLLLNGLKSMFTNNTKRRLLFYWSVSSFEVPGFFPARRIRNATRSSKVTFLVFDSRSNRVQLTNYSKQQNKANPREEEEENWGGPEAFKLILFLKDDFDVQLKKHQHIMVFFSANWCHHCRQLRKPYGMAALMSRESNLPMVFATFDINHNPDLAQEKGVVGIPLIRYYKDGKFVTNYKGKRTSAELFEFAKNPPSPSTDPINKMTDF